MDVAINVRVAACDVAAIDRLATLSGANRSDVIRAAIAAVVSDPELVTPPPLDEPEVRDLAPELEAELQAFEREHFGRP